MFAIWFCAAPAHPPNAPGKSDPGIEIRETVSSSTEIEWVKFFNAQNKILKRAFEKRAGDERLRNPEDLCFGAVFYPQFVPFWGRRRGVFGEENRVQCDSYELPRTF